MKKLNIIAVLGILFIISSCTSNREPDTDAVFKSITKEYQLNSDGSIDYQYHHELKYLTHYSFNRAYGETFVVYNPLHQVLDVVKSETTMLDGKKVESPANALNEILPHFAAGSPEYNNLREMVITHVGLEVGATVNLDYNIKSEKGYYPYLSENIVLSEKSPVNNQKIIVKIPEGKTLNYKLLNSSVKPKISKKGNFTIYTWRFGNITALSHDYNVPHDGSYLPRLIFSTANMNDALANIKNNIDLNLNDNIKKTIKEKLQGVEKPIEKIAIIKNIVANEINLISVPIEFTGYKMNSLNHVWKSNRASLIEKNFLFVELLKLSGFDADILFAYPEFTFDKEIGNLKTFGYYLVKVNIDGRDMILSLNSKQKNDLAFNLDNGVIVNINGEKFDANANIADIENKISFVTSLKMNIDGNVKGNMKAEISGAANPYFDLLKDKNNAKQVIASMTKSKMINSFELQNFDFSACSVTADIKCKKIWKEQGNYYFLNIPNSSLGIKASHLRALEENRTSPLILNSTIDETYKFSIELPDSIQFVNPINIEMKNDIGNVIISCKLDSNVLLIEKLLKINKKYIAVEDYKNFKKLIDIWNKKTNNELILKK